jgi:hypothetical protein
MTHLKITSGCITYEFIKTSSETDGALFMRYIGALDRGWVPTLSGCDLSFIDTPQVKALKFVFFYESIAAKRNSAYP